MRFFKNLKSRIDYTRWVHAGIGILVATGAILIFASSWQIGLGLALIVTAFLLDDECIKRGIIRDDEY